MKKLEWKVNPNEIYAPICIWGVRGHGMTSYIATNTQHKTRSSE